MILTRNNSRADQKARYLSGGGATPWTPSDGASNVRWWNIQDGISIDPMGQEMTAWVDRIAGATASPPTVQSRPLYGSHQINGLDVLTFRSADPNYIDIDVSNLGAGIEIHMVVNHYAGANGTLLADGDNSATLIFSRYNNSSPASTNWGNNFNYYRNGASLGINISQGLLYSSIFDQNVVLSITNLDLSSINTLNLFIRDGMLLPMSAYCGDIIVANSNADRTQNINYLINKYNL